MSAAGGEQDPGPQPDPGRHVDEGGDPPCWAHLFDDAAPDGGLACGAVAGAADDAGSDAATPAGPGPSPTG